MSYWGFQPYVSVAQRREQAAKEIEKLRKKGTPVWPIAVEGLKIAKNFWGTAWCDNLERYSDLENRLPRGRTYVRNGSVIDLRISHGKVEALVSGSEIYKVKIDIAVAASTRWKAICADCTGSVGSLIELLQGKLSKNVMARVCREADGLFPAPSEIKMFCSCPDWASMCKHVAATLYGVGARLDSDPDLLFVLRGVERAELVATVGADFPLTQTAATSERVLADDDVAALFGLEMDGPVAAVQKMESGRAKSARRGSDKTAAATRPSGQAKAGATKKKHTSGASQPLRSLAVKTLAQQNSKTAGRLKPQPEPVATASGSKRRGAGTMPAPIGPSTAAVRTAAKPQRLEPQPAGRTRAAKWIGARARKADW
jgi:uncharacterized Zn finger protein